MIRTYIPADLQSLVSLFTQTVHIVGSVYYSPEEVEAWAPSQPDVEAWRGYFDERYTLVMDSEEGITGFGCLSADGGTVDMLYSHHAHQSGGVGSAILDALEKRGVKTLGIGKIDDIFQNRGISASNHTTNNKDGINATVEALKNDREHSLIFTNLVDFDMLFGHRNDAEGYAQELEYFDMKLPLILSNLKDGDLLFITSDHGCDPTTASTDHSREYVPLLAYDKSGDYINPRDLGTRETLADLGATVYKYLTVGKWNIGESFLVNL